jgi:hypothetical protein
MRGYIQFHATGALLKRRSNDKSHAFQLRETLNAVDHRTLDWSIGRVPRRSLLILNNDGSHQDPLGQGISYYKRLLQSRILGALTGTRGGW